MNAQDFYNEHFSTIENPKGTDILEKDYNYRELLSFAVAYHKMKTDKEICPNCQNEVNSKQWECPKCGYELPLSN